MRTNITGGIFGATALERNAKIMAPRIERIGTARINQRYVKRRAINIGGIAALAIAADLHAIAEQAVVAIHRRGAFLTSVGGKIAITRIVCQSFAVRFAISSGQAGAIAVAGASVASRIARDDLRRRALFGRASAIRGTTVLYVFIDIKIAVFAMSRPTIGIKARIIRIALRVALQFIARMSYFRRNGKLAFILGFVASIDQLNLRVPSERTAV